MKLESFFLVVVAYLRTSPLVSFRPLARLVVHLHGLAAVLSNDDIVLEIETIDLKYAVAYFDASQYPIALYERPNMLAISLTWCADSKSEPGD